jgi:hypothetical protein
MPLDPLIYEYADGDVLPKYRVETPPKIISQEMMSEQLSEDTYFMSLVKLTRSDYFGGFTDIFETGDYIFLHYVANMAYPGLYVLDKNRLTGSYFTYPSGGKEFTSPMFPFSASDGNRIVSVVPFRDFMALKDLLSNNEIEQGKWSAELQGVLNGMNDQSNPLLVFYNVSAN